MTVVPFPHPAPDSRPPTCSAHRILTFLSVSSAIASIASIASSDSCKSWRELFPSSLLLCCSSNGQDAPYQDR